VNIDEFASQVDSVREVVRSTRSPGKSAARWLSILDVFLEELDVSVEELRAQNDELTLAHYLLVREAERYRQLFDLAPDGYVVTDKFGVIREVNRAASDLLSVESSALAGKPLSVFIVPRDRRQFRHLLRDLPASGFPEVATLKIQPRDRVAFNAEFTVRLGQDLGEETTVLRWSLRNVEDRDRHLRETRAISAALEQRIADQERRVEAVQAERDASLAREAGLIEMAAGARAKLLYAAESSDLISASSEHMTLMAEVLGRLVPTSSDWAIIGLVRDDGSVVESAVAHCDADRDQKMNERISAAGFVPGSMLCCAQKTLASGMPQSLARGDQFPAGFDDPGALEWFAVDDPMRFSVLSVPLRSRGRTLGVLEMGRGQSWAPFNGDDLSLTLLLGGRTASVLDGLGLSENARLTSDAHDHFVAVAAHELRTPITVLRGYAQLLSRQLTRTSPSDPARTDRIARAVEGQADRLATLVDQLVEVSHFESAPAELQPNVVDLSRLILRQVEEAQATTDRHEFNACIEPATMAVVDALRIQQVVAHLLDNAIKFSVDGGPILVGLERSADETIRLTVADHGIGVDPDHRDHIFDGFYLAHDRANIHGLGLGLYVSRQIMQQLGGDLRVEFPPDGGSRFLAELPAAPSQSHNGASASA